MAAGQPPRLAVVRRRQGSAHSQPLGEIVKQVLVVLVAVVGLFCSTSTAPAAAYSPSIYTNCVGTYPVDKTCRTYFDREMTKAAWAALKPVMGSPSKAVKTAKNFCSRTKGYAATACLLAMAGIYAVSRQIKSAAAGNDCWAFRYKLGIRPAVALMYTYVSETSACRT